MSASRIRLQRRALRLPSRDLCFEHFDCVRHDKEFLDSKISFQFLNRLSKEFMSEYTYEKKNIYIYIRGNYLQTRIPASQDFPSSSISNLKGKTSSKTGIPGFQDFLFSLK